jgi:hypothetical protein
VIVRAPTARSAVHPPCAKQWPGTVEILSERLNASDRDA